LVIYRSISINEDIKYQIYPRNWFVIALLIFGLFYFIISVLFFVDDFVIQQKVISFKQADILSNFGFLIEIVKYLELIVLIFSSIIILRRKSIITENNIITQFCCFKIEELNKVELNNNVIKYGLKKSLWHSNLLLNKFKVINNEAQDILKYLKGKIK
jgi:hypothetical protein